MTKSHLYDRLIADYCPTVNHLLKTKKTMAEERITPTKVGSHNEIEYVEHLARYTFAARFVKNGSRGLDIACGAGYGTDILLTAGASAFYGVDKSSESIEYARARYKTAGLEFIRSDALQAQFPAEYFDMITSFETIEHLEAEKGEVFIQMLNGWLKKGGVLLLSCPNRDTYPKGYAKNVFHLHEYSYREIEALLGKYFANITVYCQKMRYFKRAYKKIVQLSRHLPKKFTIRAANHAHFEYTLKKDLKYLPLFRRLALYEYFFGHEVFPFVEDYRFFKPVFFVFAAKKG